MSSKLNEGTRKLRVLHVIGGLVGGGAETQLKLILRGMDGSRFHVGVAYLNDDTNFHDRDGIECIQITRGSRYGLLSLWQRLNCAVVEFQPDVVHLWFPELMTIPCAIASRMKSIPIVSSQRRSLSSSVSIGNRVRDLAGCMTHLMSHVIVTNFPVEHEAWWFRYLYEKRDGEVVRNAISPISVGSVETDLPSSFDTGNFNVLFVGRLVAQKRLPILLRAFALLVKENPRVRLYVYGDGLATVRQSYSDLIEELGIDPSLVEFCGYRSDWRLLAPSFDVFVLPSVAEGMPNVLLEAMQAGLACIANTIPEIESIVTESDSVLLTPPDDPAELSKALLRLVNDPALREKLVDSSVAVLEQFTVNRMVRSYEALYERLAHASS